MKDELPSSDEYHAAFPKADRDWTDAVAQQLARDLAQVPALDCEFCGAADAVQMPIVRTNGTTWHPALCSSDGCRNLAAHALRMGDLADLHKALVQE